MAPHSSTLAWKIPWTEEPGRLQSVGSLSQTWLSDFTFTFHFHALEKEMATHSSVLAWRIPGTEEPGGLPSLGSHRVGHDIATNILSHAIIKNSGIFIADPVSLNLLGFPGGSDGKESACNAGVPGSIPGSGRSPGEGNGNPLQYSCLENSMDRGACRLQPMVLQRIGHD